jgi:hypothetical protein
MALLCLIWCIWAVREGGADSGMPHAVLQGTVAAWPMGIKSVPLVLWL